MAHVEKRGPGRWRARHRGPDGRERSRTFATRRDAEKWLATQEVAKAKGEWVDPALGRISVGQYIPSWLATKADVRGQTMTNIRGRIGKHIDPYFGPMLLSAVRPAHARAFVAHLVARGLAPSTVKGIALTASQVFAQAVRDGLIARSPFEGIAYPRERQRENMHFLGPAEVNVLADTITERFRVLVLTAAYTGMRAGELAALKVTDVNLLTRTIDVTRSMAEVGGELIIGPTKTGRPRSLTIPRFLAELLGAHIGRYPSPDGFVFTMAEGGPVRQRNFYRRHYRPAVAAAGLPEGLRFHDLRHTCAAILIANGRHLEELKDYLGHSSIRVTSDRYGHLFPKARLELADGLDATYLAAPAASSRPGAPVTPIQTRVNGLEKGR